MRVLVTGANGFVGRVLCRHLADKGHLVRGAVRVVDGRFPPGAEPAAVGDIGPATDWRPFLAEVDAVVHLAARVHVMHDSAPDPLAEFRRINTQGALNLARQAVAAGVKRFVFVSSIKVMGEGRDAPYTEADALEPNDPYAVSKREAEEGLRALAAATGLEIVILRPPLVFGPGVGANFLRLVRWVRGGVPLPFGAVRNRRSLVYVGNLADAIGLSLEHPAAAGRVFLVSDGEDVSTVELVIRLAGAMGCRPRLFSVPPPILAWLGRALGRSAEMDRLLGSLCVDSSLLRRTLAWSPPFSLDNGLRETVAWARDR